MGAATAMANALRHGLFNSSLVMGHLLLTILAVRGSDVTYHPGSWPGRGSRRLLESGTFCIISYQTNFAGDTPMDGGSSSQKSMDACCQSCRANSGCNAWVFCGHTGGCNDGYGKVYPFGTCTLKNQGGIEAMGSDPPVVYGSYGTSDFTSGKMVTEDYSAAVQSAPSFESYDRYPGLDFHNLFDYQCQGSALQGGYCKLSGDVVTLAQRCINENDCYAFVYRPKDGVVWFKGGPSTTAATVRQSALLINSATANPDTVLYSLKSFT